MWPPRVARTSFGFARESREPRVVKDWSAAVSARLEVDMNKQFGGKRKALKAMLKAHGIVGRWTREPNDAHMLRCDDGSGLHWSKTRGTIWFHVQPDAKRRLERRVASVLREPN